MRKAEWSLVQYVNTVSEGPLLGIERAGAVHRAPDGWPASMVELLDSWAMYELALRALPDRALVREPNARLVAPITFPRKVVCASANYYDHAREMGTAEPDPRSTMFFFLKAPTTTIVAADAEIPLPDADRARYDWEAELAVIISKGGKNISADDALGHIAGYAVANDLSARGVFAREDAVAPPFSFDWLAHKSFDASCPIGPGIVPHWLVDDVDALQLRLTVNGAVQQDSTTGNMVVGLAKLIADASSFLTLEPGDIILTGTPAGVGLPKGMHLVAGDIVVTEIDGIGRLENRMVAA